MQESCFLLGADMANSSLIKDIHIGGEIIRLLMEDEIPSVEFRDQVIHHVWILCQQCTLLTDPAYLKEFAEIGNFLWKGAAFQFIENIEEYQHFYLNQIELERQHSTDVFPYRLTDYKIFDVSVMHQPALIEDRLHFFVYQTATGVPYRVVCPFPYTSLSPLVHYQILPSQG